MAELRKRSATAARALEFLILTATRTSEALLAQWSEIDFGAQLWNIPADRMKAGKPHRVPLSDASVEILEKMRGVQQGDFVFPGMKPRRPLSNMALLTLLDRMDYAGITSHGFRSTFRDWAGEHTAHEGARLRLPDDPHAPEFWAAIRAAQGVPQASSMDTIGGLINAYIASPAFQSRAADTQSQYRHWLLVRHNAPTGYTARGKSDVGLAGRDLTAVLDL
jgi:Phage integrase family